jgi:hypothetical protein
MKIDVIPNPETVKFISSNLRELTSCEFLFLGEGFPVTQFLDTLILPTVL